MIKRPYWVQRGTLTITRGEQPSGPSAEQGGRHTSEEAAGSLGLALRFVAKRRGERPDSVDTPTAICEFPVCRTRGLLQGHGRGCTPQTLALGLNAIPPSYLWCTGERPRPGAPSRLSHQPPRGGGGGASDLRFPAVAGRREANTAAPGFPPTGLQLGEHPAKGPLPPTGREACLVSE